MTLQQTTHTNTDGRLCAVFASFAMKHNLLLDWHLRVPFLVATMLTTAAINLLTGKSGTNYPLFNQTTKMDVKS